MKTARVTFTRKRIVEEEANDYFDVPETPEEIENEGGDPEDWDEEDYLNQMIEDATVDIKKYTDGLRWSELDDNVDPDSIETTVEDIS